MSGIARHHADWLSLIEVSGPFLTLPVLVRAFPQGLPKVDGRKLGRLRAAYEEWANAQDARTTDASALHATWVRLVVGEVLEFDDKTLRSDKGVPSSLDVPLAEHHETLRPSIAIVEPSGRVKAGTPRLLVAVWPSGQDLESAVPTARWAAAPLERMTQLCRSTGVRLGLVTNGERWTLVDAPVGQTAGYGSWYAGLWLQEPSTLAAFDALLGVRRFFGVADTDTIEALLDESVAFQQEVTDQLGYQVRRAVEVLVQAVDRADLDRKRELLRDVPPARLYEAALTVMMRLVFLFCAEERGLLLLGDETYDGHYAVSTLRALLREEADLVGVEVLERRQDAWARLLATFRAVHDGIEHEALRLPALGGSLFDPDRYPFLEGRAAGTSWLDTPASPLPIDNRTVLHLLEALQLLRMRGDGGTSEARKLSYRVLDIEQIGHVYEGLLDHVAVRVDEDTLGLVGTKDKEPELSLDQLERERRGGRDEFIEFLKEHTGRSVSGLRNDLDAEPDEDADQRLLVACGNDKALVNRVAPYHALLRKDVWGYPQIYRAGSFMVTGGPERRQTGTHYTPKSLTEQIVTETLEPIVYVGPSEGNPRDAWKLRSAAELLDLKICDLAMGSGAFLVQVCRWLAERVVEAWEEVERQGAAISSDGVVLDRAAGHDLLPPDREERLSFARRLVAERCVYGVDINPMAVELAKLSLWLVTLAKGRPFAFLDHNLRSGDSLLGITSLDQLENFHLDPARGERLHHTLFDPRHEIQAAVTKALEARQRLRAIRIRDIEDVRAMARLDGDAKAILRQAELAADLLVGAAVATADLREEALDEKLLMLAEWLQGALAHSAGPYRIEQRAREQLDVDCPERLRPRHTFHWALDFPEVFTRARPGFDAVVSNPPFLGGLKISGTLGDGYRRWLDRLYPHGNGRADLVAYFFLRAFGVSRTGRVIGLLATNTIAEGETRDTGLANLVAQGARIASATRELKWPGRASLTVSKLVIADKDTWSARAILDGRAVNEISPSLTDDSDANRPFKLAANLGISFQGANVHGMGFILEESEAKELLSARKSNAKCVFRFMIGDDLNNHPLQQPSRWVIDFRDRPLHECESEWPEVLDRVRRLVKPVRVNQKDKRARENWWWHYRPATSLYAATRDLHRFLATCEVTKHLSFSFLRPGWVISSNVDVIALDGYEHFAALQSTVHEIWARRWCSRLETRLKYSNGNAFETFPFPANLASLRPTGESYYEARLSFMRANDEGLTKTYNRFHDPEETGPNVEELRTLHRAVDIALIGAYGWDDIDLRHGFYELPALPSTDRTRFTVPEYARIEILRRLADLNRTRYESEVREGLHGPAEIGVVDLEDARRRRAQSGRGSVREAGAVHNQGDFAFEDSPRKVSEPRTSYDAGNSAARRIREWLVAHRGWHAKDEILSGTQVDPDEWMSAIKELLESGAVAKQGERRGSEYKAK